MKVAILTIGDEVVAGDIANTNTTFLAEECWSAGFTVIKHLSVCDDEYAIAEALRGFAREADIVLCTGGLGPTMDDFTIEIAAKTFGVALKEDAQTVALLEKYFASRNRAMAPNNRKQALIPETGIALHNKWGTAPGVYVPFQKAHFYFMPGVPREMKAIFADSIFPNMLALRKQAGENISFSRKTFRSFGATESELDNKLKDLFTSRLTIGNVRIGFRVVFPEIWIKMSCWQTDEASARQEIADVENKIRERVGDYIFSDDNKTLEKVVIEKMTANKISCACAESCTGGLLAERITAVAGASRVFVGGIVSYANEMKAKSLGVSKDTLDKYGAVSEECAREMLAGIEKLTGADYLAAITGIAGPSGGTGDKPVGTVFIAIKKRNTTVIQKKYIPFPREMFRQVVSSLILREWWLGLDA